MSQAYFTALGTQSSAATIPVTLAKARKTGASKRVTDFTVPIFVTINLTGSTITIVTCAIGVLLLNGQAIDLKEMVPFIFMLGVTMIALMIALYIAQDSFGTATNVTGSINR